MDSEQTEQAFDAIYMAILLGHKRAARRVFDRSLERYCKEQVTPIIPKLTSLAEKIERSNLTPFILKLTAWELMNIADELEEKVQ